MRAVSRDKIARLFPIAVAASLLILGLPPPPPHTRSAQTLPSPDIQPATQAVKDSFFISHPSNYQLNEKNWDRDSNIPPLLLNSHARFLIIV